MGIDSGKAATAEAIADNPGEKSPPSAEWHHGRRINRREGPPVLPFGGNTCIRRAFLTFMAVEGDFSSAMVAAASTTRLFAPSVSRSIPSVTTRSPRRQACAGSPRFATLNTDFTRFLLTLFRRSAPHKVAPYCPFGTAAAGTTTAFLFGIDQHPGAFTN